MRAQLLRGFGSFEVSEAPVVLDRYAGTRSGAPLSVALAHVRMVLGGGISRFERVTETAAIAAHAEGALR